VKPSLAEDGAQKYVQESDAAAEEEGAEKGAGLFYEFYYQPRVHIDVVADQ
jgi:hypothetical protein